MKNTLMEVLYEYEDTIGGGNSFREFEKEKGLAMEQMIDLYLDYSKYLPNSEDSCVIYGFLLDSFNENMDLANRHFEWAKLAAHKRENYSELIKIALSDMLKSRKCYDLVLKMRRLDKRDNFGYIGRMREALAEFIDDYNFFSAFPRNFDNAKIFNQKINEAVEKKDYENAAIFRDKLYELCKKG